ncbi:MAG TPA: MBL fold metallo-hydrolase [Puia sp.]|jgi:glyoxylase-like metal-dependent hydrolase (beta-lactamase superfamily II)|nr:MBL fold metallo-hydrolase [Puia sp.]
MQRRNFLRNTSLSFGALSLLNTKLFANMLKEDPWKMKMLRNNVGIFTEKGGTIGYLLTDKGIVVVDTEFPEQSQHLIDALKKQSDKSFEMLINTHHHGDHTSGNISFKGIVKDVAAHTNSLANQQKVAIAQKTEDKQLYPNITYDDSWKYSIDKETIQTHYFGPAHTNGDSIIHFQNANIAHVGDLMFNRRWAFIDRSAGASVKNWVTVLDKALGTFDNDTIFIFGHAFDPEKVTGNKDDLRAMQNYLAKMLDFVEKEIKAGKSKDDILKEKAIPGVTEWQGDGIERGLQATYEELMA